MLVNEKRYKGTLDLKNEDNDWVFMVRNRTGQIVLEHGLYDLPYSWRTRMIEESLIVGHQPTSSDDIPQYSQPESAARHVSASSLHEPNPKTLRKALNPKFADHKVWLESYQEEYDGLMSMDTMEILTTSQYSNLKNAPKAIPTMCVLTVKTNENNKPAGASQEPHRRPRQLGRARMDPA